MGGANSIVVLYYLVLHWAYLGCINIGILIKVGFSLGLPLGLGLGLGFGIGLYLD